MNIIKPKLTAIHLPSGTKSTVDWIDLDAGTCKTKLHMELPINDFTFCHPGDYDSLRGQFAGQAMQAIVDGMCANTMLMEQMSARAVREGYKSIQTLVADTAVSYADALVKELQRGHDLKYFGIKVSKKEDSQ